MVVKTFTYPIGVWSRCDPRRRDRSRIAAHVEVVAMGYHPSGQRVQPPDSDSNWMEVGGDVTGTDFMPASDECHRSAVSA
jgi:hypothetical protein